MAEPAFNSDMLNRDIDGLLASPSPEYIEEFNKRYGTGEAERTIRELRPDLKPPSGTVVPQQGDGSEVSNNTGFWDHVSEIPSSALRGATKSIDATSNWLSRNIGTITFVDENGEFDIQVQSGDDVERLMREGKWGGGLTEVVGIDAPTTMTGSAVEGISQFTVGFVGVGKFFKLGKLFSGASKGKQAFISSMSRGAAADFFAFEGKEGNLSDFLNGVGVDNVVVRNLMTDPDSSDNMNRLRTAIEGAGIGFAVEGIIKVVRAAGYFKRGDKEKAAELGGQGAEEIKQGTLKFADDTDATATKNGDEISDPVSPKETTTPPPKIEETSVGDQGELFPLSDAELIARETDYKKRFSDKSDKKTFPVFREVVERIAHGSGWRHTQSGEVARPGEITKLLKGVKNAEDVQDVIATVTEVVAKEIDVVRGGSEQSWRSVKAQARIAIDDMTEAFGGNPDDFIAKFNSLDGGDWHKLAAQIVSKKRIAITMSRELQHLSNIYRDLHSGALNKEGLKELGWDSVEEFELNFDHISEIHANVIASWLGQRTAMGRAFNAMKIWDTAGGNLDKNLIAQMENMMGRSRSSRLEFANEVADLADGSLAPNPGAVGSVWDRLNTFRINMMLSGPNTQIINAVSNFMNANILMFEQMVGGAMRGSREEMIRGFKQFGGTYGSALEALRMAAYAARQDQSVLDAVGGKLEVNTNPFGGQKLSLVDKEGRSIQGAGNIIATLPSRLLLFSDEFFKQATYRGKLKADLWVAGREKGLQGDELAKWIADAEKRAFNPEGAAAGLDPDQFIENLVKEGTEKGLKGKALEKFVKENSDQVNVSKAALDTSREATFTTELEGFAARIQAIAVQYPVARFVLPFVKTPTNLILAAARRMPLSHKFSRKMREDLNSPDPSIRSQARGKQATGFAVLTIAGTLAAQEKITGAGPSNPKTRKDLMATGWRPYSFVIDNEDGSKSYLSYHRYDPFSNFLGIAADLVGIMKEAELEGKKGEETRIQDVLIGTFGAIAENSINKTYLRGLSDFMGAITASDKNMERVLGSILSSYTPAAVGQLDGDELFRETRGVLTQLQNRLAGAGVGEFSDPKRNQLGEPMYRQQDKWNPFTLSTTDPNDTVLKELANLSILTGKSFGTPQNKRIGTLTDFQKVEYQEGQSVFDRYVEITGTVELGGKTLRERLESIIPRLQKYNPGDRDDKDSPRTRVLERVFNTYRKAARYQMLRDAKSPDAPTGLKQWAKEFRNRKREKVTKFKQTGEFNLESMIRGR